MLLLNRPGGNVTGVSFVAGLLGPKRLEMLRQLVPTAATIAILVGTDTLEARIERRDVELAAQALGQQLIVAPVTSEGKLDGAFTSIVERGAKALLGGSGEWRNERRQSAQPTSASRLSRLRLAMRYLRSMRCANLS